MALRIGVDIGGTFTDLSLLDDDSGRIVGTFKVPSRPDDAVAAVVEGVRHLLEDREPQDVQTLLHGSTVALNALLSGSEPAPALLTTEGFRSVYELGRQWRADRVYDLQIEGPAMLLPSWNIVEVPERIGAHGEVVRPLTVEAAERAVDRVLELGVQSIAIALLFAFAHPEHERLLARILRKRAPEVYVATSSQVSPEFREYERTATTVVNAYVGPKTAQYLRAFETSLQHVLPRADVLIMQSNGGTATVGSVVETPVRTLMSGPVAGVVGAKFLADQLELRDVITVDVGGTSCDMAVVPGEIAFQSQSQVGSHVIRAPSVDMHTIGSGGGSVAWLGPGQVLKVGPRSAGAEPGPACYGRGGTEATLTDALLVLGALDEASFLGGRMAIRADLAKAAVARCVGEPLGMSPERAAAGIVRVLTSQVALAMRSITVERGYDPREFSLLAFGGAGPTLAVHLARELGIPSVVVPEDPGNFCAFGMLVSDIRHDVVRTRIGLLDEVPRAELATLFDELRAECAAGLAEQGVARDRMALEQYVDMRYVGQSYEVMVPLRETSGEMDFSRLESDFHQLHERRYGHKAPGERVEVVAFRVRGVGLIGKPRWQSEPLTADDAPRPLGERAQLFDVGRGFEPTPVYRRSALKPGARLRGPAIVEEPSSTTILGPDHVLSLDGFWNLRIDLNA